MCTCTRSARACNLFNTTWGKASQLYTRRRDIPYGSCCSHCDHLCSCRAWWCWSQACPGAEYLPPSTAAIKSWRRWWLNYKTQTSEKSLAALRKARSNAQRTARYYANNYRLNLCQLEHPTLLIVATFVPCTMAWRNKLSARAPPRLPP